MAIISRQPAPKPPQKIKRILNIREFYEKRKYILIVRAVGGLGDILMHRMLFEDIKMIMPDCEIHFACPAMYHEAIVDHPYLDKLIDSGTVDKTQYLISYNTTTACGRYEIKIAPHADLHRSDIWAMYCGLKLTRHNMHIRLSEEEKLDGLQKLESVRDRAGKICLLSPISAMENKNLQTEQLLGIIEGLHNRGICVVGLHSEPIEPIYKLGLPGLFHLKVRQWMSVISAADYVISVDTSTFHCAGGMRKPLVGIYTFANGQVYGQYYDTAEIVQGPCPFGHKGCYNWPQCPKLKEQKMIPCCKDLLAETILASFDRLMLRFSK